MANDTAIEDNIIHYSKRVPFGGASGIEDWVEEGVNWSGAAFVMTLAANEGGSALITLTNQTAGTQGISATYDANYVGVSGAVVGATTIRPQIDEATIEALTFPAAPAPLELVYDLLVTPSGGVQQLLYYGTFTIRHGVGD